MGAVADGPGRVGAPHVERATRHGGRDEVAGAEHGDDAEAERRRGCRLRVHRSVADRAVRVARGPAAHRAHGIERAADERADGDLLRVGERRDRHGLQREVGGQRDSGVAPAAHEASGGRHAGRVGTSGDVRRVREIEDRGGRAAVGLIADAEPASLAIAPALRRAARKAHADVRVTDGNLRHAGRVVEAGDERRVLHVTRVGQLRVRVLAPAVDAALHGTRACVDARGADLDDVREVLHLNRRRRLHPGVAEAGHAATAPARHLAGRAQDAGEAVARRDLHGVGDAGDLVRRRAITGHAVAKLLERVLAPAEDAAVFAPRASVRVRSGDPDGLRRRRQEIGRRGKIRAGVPGPGIEVHRRVDGDAAIRLVGVMVMMAGGGNDEDGEGQEAARHRAPKVVCVRVIGV